MLLLLLGAVWTVTMKRLTPFPLSLSNEVSLLWDGFSLPASAVMQSDTHVFRRASHLPGLHHTWSRGAEGSAEQRAQPEPSHALLSGKGLGNWAVLEGKKINNNDKRLPELSSPLQCSQLNAVSSLPLGVEASGIRSCFRRESRWRCQRDRKWSFWGRNSEGGLGTGCFPRFTFW